jgi:hypothetical protein
VVDTAQGSSGWYGLLAIVTEARERAREPETACPNDGEPYTTGPDGAPFCRFDGYRPLGLAPTSGAAVGGDQ